MLCSYDILLCYSHYQILSLIYLHPLFIYRYSRLYREVLNRYHWAESMEAFITPHEETGVFGIDGSCPLEHTPQLIQVSLSLILSMMMVYLTVINLLLI
jgi:hypothetical protein